MRRPQDSARKRTHPLRIRPCGTRTARISARTTGSRSRVGVDHIDGRRRHSYGTGTRAPDWKRPQPITIARCVERPVCRMRFEWMRLDFENPSLSRTFVDTVRINTHPPRHQSSRRRFRKKQEADPQGVDLLLQSRLRFDPGSNFEHADTSIRGYRWCPRDRTSRRGPDRRRFRRC